MKRVPQVGLFDDTPPEVVKPRVKPEDCKHIKFKNTVTTWPGENFERLTSTCVDCDKVFGRFYNKEK